MKPVPVALCAAAVVAGAVAVAVYQAPRQVKLPVYSVPVEFFSEEKQALLVGNLPKGISSMSAEACGSCHKAEYAEWKASAHSRSVTEPVFASAFKAEPRFLCRSCHSPLEEQHPTLVTRIHKQPQTLVHGMSLAARPAAPVAPAHGKTFHAFDPRTRSFQPFLTEKNPKYDAALVKEGVTCVTCHVRDETILSSKPTGSSKVPHPLSYSPVMAKADYCAGCHQFDIASPQLHPFEKNPVRLTQQQRVEQARVQHAMLLSSARQVHGRPPVMIGGRVVAAPPTDEDEPPVLPSPGMDDQYQQESRVQHTFDEFRISPAALKGQQCQTCHMTKVAGRATHNWPGRDSVKMLRDAVSLAVRLDRPSYTEGEKLQAVIRLKNDAGHRFPTGDSIHAGILDVWLRDGKKTLGRQVFVMSSQQSGRFVNFGPQIRQFEGFGRAGSAGPILEAPQRADTRILPGEEMLLVYKQQVSEEMARAKDLNLRVRVFHAAMHPGFKNSSIDPGLNTVKVFREEVLPVKVGEKEPAAPVSSAQRAALRLPRG